jgi:hypothetical protein
MGRKRVSRNGSSGASNGLAILVGTGNEFRVTRTFAIAPQLEYVWMRLGGEVTGNYLSLTGAFTWYWGAPREQVARATVAL